MLKKLSFLPLLAIAMIANTTHADIVVESQASFFGTDTGNADGAVFDFPDVNGVAQSFDAMGGDFLVVGVGVESLATGFSLSFGGNALTLSGQSASLNDAGDTLTGEQTAIFTLDLTGLSTTGTFAFSGTGQGFNDPGLHAVALSGTNGVVEANGAFNGGFGDLTGALTGVSDGSFVLATATDQLGGNQDIGVTGDLTEVSVFGGGNGSTIGSAAAAVGTGFGTGADLTVTFSDAATAAQDNDFNNRSNFSFVSIQAAAAVPEPSSFLLLTGLCGLVAARRRRS